MIRLLVIAVLMPVAADAQSLIAARTLPAHSIIGPADVVVAPREAEGAAQAVSEVEGQEVRTAVYRGQPILLSNLARAAEVERNQLVTILYASGRVTISAEGRALDRGGVGERIRVMNTGSRTTVLGAVAPGGTIRVGATN
ncbi:MAG: flagellar basal body P-ring formation protein FlgA [Proteobacteria bacterium]|nr:flagellar basal body P-ring formation protein FlgA [Pseudomonadota bacterium]MBS0572867.1 flagellar basal body P-ring formation protein FlgA [Pseudomonadota bacterium]